MGHGSVNNNNSFAFGNAANRPASGAGDKLPLPDGRTLLRIDVRSSVQPDKNGKVIVPDADIERAVFAHFGLKSESKEDLQRLKDILKTTENPFQFVKTSAGERRDYRADHVYRIPLSIQNSLLAKLSGTAAEVKRQIREEKLRQTSTNPNETVAGKTGYDAARQQRAKLNRLIWEAQVLPSSFGIPSKLTDLTHVVLTLPAGSAPTADNALSAYIEKRFGGGNLFGENKIDIQNAARQSGVRIENLKVSPNNNRVVEFDLNLESVLKLQKAYLDVQEKVNNDIAVADDVRDKMALNQFLLGVMDGAIEDVKGNYNTIRHPLETLQGIRDAVNVLSQLTAEDVKNIAAELGSKAANATPGEAAHAAGVVVGTVVVEAILAKGAGAALSALGKTKAGAEFLARIGKLAERTGELANLGKAKVAEMFTDEAANLAKQKFAGRLRELNLSPNSITNIAADPELWARASQVAGNAIGKGYTKFADFSRQVVKELGNIAEPQIKKLYRESLISLDLNGKQILSSSGRVIDEAVVREAKEKVFDLVSNNKSVELEEFFEGRNGIRNKYGSEFVDELKQTRDKFVDNLSETTRRTVDTHDLLGGHIRDKHIGRSDAWLQNRLRHDPELKNVNFASSFYNEETANRAMGKFVNQYRSEIDVWLKNPNSAKFEKIFDFGESAGIVAERGRAGFKESGKVYVMMTKDSTVDGWHFVTAYPAAVR